MNDVVVRRRRFRLSLRIYKGNSIVYIFSILFFIFLWCEKWKISTRTVPLLWWCVYAGNFISSSQKAKSLMCFSSFPLLCYFEEKKIIDFNFVEFSFSSISSEYFVWSDLIKNVLNKNMPSCLFYSNFRRFLEGN